MVYTYRKIPIPLPWKYGMITIAGATALLVLGETLNLVGVHFAPLVILAGPVYFGCMVYIEKRRKNLTRFHNDVVLVAKATRYIVDRSSNQKLPSGLSYHFDQVRKVLPANILRTTRRPIPRKWWTVSTSSLS